MNNKYEYGFFEYEIEYWDPFTEKMTTSRGVVYADTFTNAVKNLEKHYEGIEKFTIYGLEPFSVYEFNYDDNNFKIECECK